MIYGAKLEGFYVDQYAWALAFPRGIDPWVETWGPSDPLPTFVLVAALFQAPGPMLIYQQAPPLVDQLNGAMALAGAMGMAGPARPLTFSLVVGRDDEGNISEFPFNDPTWMEHRSRAKAYGVMRSQEDSSLAPKSPSAAGALVARGQGDDDHGDLLRYLGKSDNWYDLYKATELIKVLAGSKHAFDRIYQDSSTFNIACANANYNRHARAPKPPTSLSLEECHSIICQAAKFILQI